MNTEPNMNTTAIEADAATKSKRHQHALNDRRVRLAVGAVAEAAFVGGADLTGGEGAPEGIVHAVGGDIAICHFGFAADGRAIRVVAQVAGLVVIEDAPKTATQASPEAKTSPRHTATVLTYAAQVRARLAACCTPGEFRRLAIAFSRLPSQIRNLVRPALAKIQAGVAKAWSAATLGEFFERLEAMRAEVSTTPTARSSSVRKVPTLAGSATSTPTYGRGPHQERLLHAQGELGGAS